MAQFMPALPLGIQYTKPRARINKPSVRINKWKLRINKLRVQINKPRVHIFNSFCFMNLVQE